MRQTRIRQRTAPRIWLGPWLGAAVVALSTLGCAPDAGEPIPPPVGEFLEQAAARTLEAYHQASLAEWEHATNITDETTARAAAAKAEQIAVTVELAKGAARYNDLDVSPSERRQLELLKTALTLPASSDPEARRELSEIASRLESRYGTGRYCPEDGSECLELEDLESILDTGRDPAGLLDAWRGWRTISPPMRAEFERLVELANQGARELGFADVGALWRSKYDMPADAFTAELERLWGQVSPLYEALHCHVRARLVETYGPELVPPEGPIPAHLLGNMWAQTWSNVYPLVRPEDGDPGFDLTERLRARGVDPVEMVRIGEGFFTSLGFEPLPETFWQRSLFTKPEDRSVACHASAWQLDLDQDVRLKMCIEVNAEDFATIHHELGHNYYQLAYRHQPVLFRDSANDGFHEAVGDTLALSVTPAYLVELGLIEREPPPEADLGLLLLMALDKVAFLPFGLLVDQWRFRVFSGEISPEEYNRAWWELRTRYQGVAPPIERSEEDFDPGAKYHVPANVPYTRYFLAHILQFQFHRDLCAAAGFEGPLNRCSIYANAAAGEQLGEMMALGQSRPWPEALTQLGGGEGKAEMDARAILDYFAPLQAWLERQNEGRVCGW